MYALIDPRNDEIFYIGKGTGDRLQAHGRDSDRRRVNGSDVESAKMVRFDAIKGAGETVRIDVIRLGIATEQEDCQIEGALIDTLPGLLNKVRGHGIDDRRSARWDLIERYGPAPCSHPSSSASRRH